MSPAAESAGSARATPRRRLSGSGPRTEAFNREVCRPIDQASGRNPDAAHRVSDAQVRSTAEVPDAVFLHGLDGTFVWVNGATRKSLGVPVACVYHRVDGFSVLAATRESARGDHVSNLGACGP